MGKTNTNWSAVRLFRDSAERINCTEHFRLKRYQVTIKEIAKVRYGTHCRYNVNYHFIWIPKTRMKMLVEPFRPDVARLIEEISAENKWHLLALEIVPDHIHCFLSAHPKLAPMKVVQVLKQETSRNLREKYAIIRATRSSEDFLATGYYCGTAGHVSAEQVAKYIIEQTRELRKNCNLFDIKPFEYDINEVKNIDKEQT